LNIEPAKEQDLEEILALQKLSYRTEAEIYRDCNIQPLTQTIEQMRAEFKSKIILKATKDKKIVGSVRGFIQDKTGFIEKLITHPNFKKQEIGTALLKAIEEGMAEAERFRLFAGYLSVNDFVFYRKRGYLEFEREAIKERLTLVWFEKNRQG
jgi:N-acetylglutamate synthase-like GNAT family acetyltransferase